MGKRRGSVSVPMINKLFGWLRNKPIKVKIFLGIVLSLFAVVTLKVTVKNDDYFFVASEAIHAMGIIILIYKLTTQKTCSGLSSKTQELTAMYLAVRLISSTAMEADIHTVLDFTTLIFTLWVIFMIRLKLKSSYINDLDNFPLYYVAIPSAVLGMLIHPYTQHHRLIRIIWAFGCYVESVSVLPQLHLIQNAKMIEPFTAHYVFALGISRFLAFAHWVIRVYETGGLYFYLFGNGYFWFVTACLAEIVQTTILADFCYYYVQSFMQGQLLIRLPV